jgi:hypothetical protein
MGSRLLPTFSRLQHLSTPDSSTILSTSRINVLAKYSFVPDSALIANPV